MCLYVIYYLLTYVTQKNALKTHDKTKGKRKENGFTSIRIEVYYWVLPDKSQTKIIMSIYNTEKI